MEFQAFLLEFLAFWVKKLGFSKWFFLDWGQKFQRELIEKLGRSWFIPRSGNLGNWDIFCRDPHFFPMPAISRDLAALEP